MRKSKSTLLERCSHKDISYITLREWEDMHKGDVKSFLKKAFRFLANIILRILKQKLFEQLDKYHNQIFKEFGVPEQHLLEVASLKKELRLRCDAIIKSDSSKTILADIEKETREGKKAENKGRTIGSILAEINLNKGTNYTIDNTMVKQYYETINVMNNA